MARRTFFSFDYRDVNRVMVVRNSKTFQEYEDAGYIDAADFEKIERQGENAIKQWIDDQLQGTSVTVVLVGKRTCDSKWVKYEIEESEKRGNGLLGIDISKIKDISIKDVNRQTSTCCGKIPKGYPFYLWNNDNGYQNLGDWIEEAARAAGR